MVAGPPGSGAALALEPQTIQQEQPDWRVELLLVLAGLLALGLVVVLAELLTITRQGDRAAAAADFWKAKSLRGELTAAVRLEPDNAGGFTCRQYNIRPEWELAIAAECERLAGLMFIARATR